MVWSFSHEPASMTQLLDFAALVADAQRHVVVTTRTRVRRHFGGGMLPVRRDWAWALAKVVAAAERLLATTDPRRLKSCANSGCTWLFLDESRNLSRRWCDPATCGNLITVREFRRRQRATAATT